MQSIEFYGKDIAAETCDEIAVNRIGKKILKDELELFEKKWFDYRSLHPTIATYLYAHYYTEAFKNDVKHYKDLKKSKYARGIKTRDFTESKERVALWKGRMMADSLSMPYDKFINYAMEFHRKHSNWARTPRPCHLTMEESVDYALFMWQEKQKQTITIPETINCGDVRLHLEIQYWICEQIKLKERPHIALASYMFDAKIVTPQVAIVKFNKDVLVKARDFFAQTR